MANLGGPVCNEPEQQVPSFLRPVSGPPISGNRRPSPELGGASGLCLSPVQLDKEGLEQGEGIPRSRIDAHSPSLASEGMVPRSSGSDCGTTNSVTTEERSAQTVSFPPIPPKRPRASTSCLETVRRFSRYEGFSNRVAKHLMSARRDSTNRNYQSKWNIYRRWCNRNNHSVSNPSLPKIADFLTFLFDKKGLSVQAIKGYRSMLSVVFKSIIPELSNSPVIKDLLRSFYINKPVGKNQKLGWDVNKVLNTLRSRPFEP